MFIGSKISPSKTVHCNQCRHAKTIRKSNRLNFPHVEEATQQGYTLPPCCATTVRGYRSQKERIDTFCSTYHLTLFWQGTRIYLETGKSSWLIDTDEAGNLQLFHRNTQLRVETEASLHPGYHLQRCPATSLLQMLLYIVNHDAFRTIHPLSTPKKCRKKAPKLEIPGQLSLYS